MHSAPESPLRRASVEYYYPYANERYEAKESNWSDVQTVQHGHWQPLMKYCVMGQIHYRQSLTVSRRNFFRASATSPLAGGVGHCLPRMQTWLVRGHLADELFDDRVGKGLVTLGRDHEGAWATDHVVRVIALEVGFHRRDWQAVDDDASAHRVV